MNEFCENDYYNNGKGKITGTKCGEIFTTENEIFNVLCTFCGTILKDIEGFTLHFKKNHNDQFEYDEEIEIEDLSNDDASTDPIGQHKLEVSDASEEPILENIIEIVDTSDLQNESTDSKSILDKNIDYRDTTRTEEKNSGETSEEHRTENKSRKISRSRMPTLHVCNICNKVFKQEPVLQSHIKYDHNTTYSFVDNLNNREGNQEGDEFNLDPVQSIANDPLKCRYCDLRFKGRVRRFEHECLHTGERPYKCKICEKTFRVQSTLKAHLQFHENKKKFKCDICEKGFNSSTNLIMHLRRHNNEKPYKCSFCNKGFIQNTEKQHHERVHTGEKPFQCTECGQRYVRSSYLSLHFRKKHVPQITIKCENCDKTFKSKERLKEHQVVHNRDYRPYKCDVCDATFQRRNAFSEHKKLHLDEFRYTCNICGKGFKQFAGLYSHKKSHGETLQKATNKN